jgi:hypothetical protein
MQPPRYFRTASPVRLLLISLIALPFAVIGTAMAYRAAWTVISAVNMQSWPSVPATLQQVELKQVGANSVRVAASYTYSVNGQQFTGKRVSLYPADNLAGFHKRAADELRGYLVRQAPFPAHVNPKDPTEAILMPVVRWEVVAFDLIFVVVFGAVGWTLLTSCYLGYRKFRKEAALVAQYPDEPWRQRVEWSTGRIKSTVGSFAIAAFCFAVFWNVCTWPMLFAVPEKLRAGQYLGLLFFVFPLIGVGLLYWTGISVARAFRFGRTYLELDTFPAKQGQHLRGRIRAPAALAESEEAKLVLTCERNYGGSKGGGSGVNTETIWEMGTTSQIVRSQSATGNVTVDVDFLVPDSLPDSSHNGDEWFTWQLTASAALKSADFEAEFEVPVFGI